MPIKERYRKIVLNENKCPKCGRLKDDRDFITCSRCRTERKTKAKYNEIRKSAMSLFGVKRR